MKLWFSFILALSTLALFANPKGTPHMEHPQVQLQTSEGTIVLELYPDKAPKTVENFLTYVREGHYDGTIFHRVISDFMIQGGGFSPEMEEKSTHAAIENEAANRLKNEKGSIAMARTDRIHSATAQFFINVKDNDFLNFREPSPMGFGYCVFGKVIKGMDVVEKIEGVKTGSKGFHQDVPVNPVVIEAATILKPGKNA